MFLTETRLRLENIKLAYSKVTIASQFHHFFKNNYFICCSITVSTTNGNIV